MKDTHIQINELHVHCCDDHHHHSHKPKKEPYVLLSFNINNFKFKTKGGSMTFEQTASQRTSFNAIFKNKNGGNAFVDGAVPVKLKDPNTGEEITVPGVTLSATPVSPNDAGNSSTHEVKLETGPDDFTSSITADIVASPDIDVENDADDSTSDDVETKDFVLATVVFKPMSAAGVVVEGLTTVDVPVS